MPDQLPAQGGAEHELVVAGEAGDARAGAGLHDGERGTGAFDLAGGGAEQLTRGGEVHAEDGGHLVGGELMAHGEFERLALLGGGAGGLRPGQQGEFTPALRLGLFGDGGAQRLGRAPVGGVLVRRLVSRPARRLARGLGVALVGTFVTRTPPDGGVCSLAPAPRLGELAQTGPARQRVQPRPAVVRGLRGARAPALGQRENIPEGGGRRVVVAQDGQAVGEQAVQIGLVARGWALSHGGAGRRATGRGRPLARVSVRPVCAGGVRGGLRTAAHHPCDRRRQSVAPSSPLSTFNPYG